MENRKMNVENIILRENTPTPTHIVQNNDE